MTTFSALARCPCQLCTLRWRCFSSCQAAFGCLFLTKASKEKSNIKHNDKTLVQNRALMLLLQQAFCIQNPLFNGGPSVPEVFLTVIPRYKLPLHPDQGWTRRGMGDFILYYSSSERRCSLYYYCTYRDGMEFHKAYSHRQGKETLYAGHTVAGKNINFFNWHNLFSNFSNFSFSHNFCLK